MTGVQTCALPILSRATLVSASISCVLPSDIALRNEINVLFLFIAMVKDSDYDSDIDPILCAYVSYARCRTYFKILFQENTFPGITAFEYGVSEDAIMNEIDMARYYASIFLFTECKEEIFQSFLEFTKKTNAI